MKKTARNLILIFFIVVIVGFSLMVLCYTLPTEHAYKTVVADGDQFHDLHPALIPDYESTTLDLYTDSKILSECSYYKQNVSLLVNAMQVYGTVSKNFTKYVHGDNDTLQGYARYWHGDVVIYKPLLTFLDYDAIKILELFFQFVMIVAIIKLMFDNGLKNYVIPFAVSLALINAQFIGLCLQYCDIFNITLISIFVLLKFKEYLLENNRMLYYFLIIGMVTNFFDLLTFPLISFGIPMIFYLLIQKDNSIKENILKIFLFGGIWVIGYGGMWVSKWIISTLILNIDIVANGIGKIFQRTSTEDYTRLGAVLRNVLIYKKRAYIIIMALILIYYVKRFITERENISKENINKIIPLILIAVTPFVWLFVASNHSYVHYRFTYKLLFIFFFAAMCILELILTKKDDAGSQ